MGDVSMSSEKQLRINGLEGQRQTPTESPNPFLGSRADVCACLVV